MLLTWLHYSTFMLPVTVSWVRAQFLRAGSRASTSRARRHAVECHSEPSPVTLSAAKGLMYRVPRAFAALRITGLGGRSNEDGNPARSGFTHRENKERAPPC